MIDIGVGTAVIIAAMLGYIGGSYIWWSSFARHFGSSFFDVLIWRDGTRWK